MISINEQNFKEKILRHDNKDWFNIDLIDDKDQDEFNTKIDAYVNNEILHFEKSVLGLDIYHYSQYPANQQVLIPMIFDLLLNQTIEWCNKDETGIFYDGFNLKKNFIHTGDGGFLIFDFPIQAIVFSINFFTILNLFNSGHFFPRLSSYVDGIVCRSVITTNTIYQYNNNWFGPGIITNARILSKDKLNRFLIDDNTNKWFLHKFNGIETLSIIDLNDIMAKIYPKSGKYISAIFKVNSDYKNTDIYTPQVYNAIKNCHLQKIGQLNIKELKISVYNVEIQRIAEIGDEQDSEKKIRFIATIGNLYPGGIDFENF